MTKVTVIRVHATLASICLKFRLWSSCLIKVQVVKRESEKGSDPSPYQRTKEARIQGQECHLFADNKELMLSTIKKFVAEQMPFVEKQKVCLFESRGIRNL